MNRRRYWVHVTAVIPLWLMLIVAFAGVVAWLGVVPLLPRALAPFAITPMGLLLFVALQFSAQLELADEGFSVSWFGKRRRFVPSTEIARVAREFGWIRPSHRVVVRCRRERLVSLPALSSGAADEIEERLRYAAEASRYPRPVPAPVPELLALRRGDRSAEEWIAHLRQLGDGGTPRSGGPPREVLWVVAQRSDAPRRARIAAAVALTGAEATAADRARVAELAKILTASPPLDEDELSLSRALAALSAKK